MLTSYEQAVGLLDEAGFARPDVMPVLTALENLVLGSALDLAAPETMWEVGDESATPRLAAALAASPAPRADAAFEFALAGFVEHCRRLLGG